MRTRGAHHVFSTGEEVSLVDFLAAEVRRARRGDQRAAHDSVIALTEVELRRRRAKAHQAPGALARHEDESGDDLLPDDANSIDVGYWRGGDEKYQSAMSVERSTLRSKYMHSIFVVKSHRALVCPIRGSAGETIVNFLEKLEEVIPGTLQPLSSYSIRDRERFLASNDIFRFVFVRHPFYRAATAYLRGVSSGDIDSEAYRNFMGLVRGRPLNENEHELQRLSMLFYLTFLARQPAGSLDSQFKSQVDICGIGVVDYDVIGRVESFAHDIGRVAGRLGLDATAQAPTAADAERDHGVPDTNVSSASLQLFASSKHRSKASKLYATDLSTLGYSPTQPPTFAA